MLATARRTQTLTSYLAESAATLARLVPRFVRRVDPKPVHAARVAARRTQTALWLARQGDARLTFPELEAGLKALTRALGARRDLDVALETDPSLDLLRRRKVMTAELAAAAAPERWTAVAQELDRAVDTVAAAAATLDLPAAQLTLRKKLGRWLAHPPKDTPAVHELRKSLKRARYAMEALDLDASPLHGVQHELGQMHDAQVLMELRGKTKALHRIAAKHEKKGLKKARKALKHARHELKGG